MRTTERTTGMIHIGRNLSGEDLYMQVTIGPMSGTQGTVDHGTIENPIEIAVTGELRERNDRGRYGSVVACGMLHDELATDQLSLILCPIEDLFAIRKLAGEWHLNTMHGECVHQDRAAHVDPSGRDWLKGADWDAMIREQTGKCPFGYRYGSAWLTKPVTPDVMAVVEDLLARYPSRG